MLGVRMRRVSGRKSKMKRGWGGIHLFYPPKQAGVVGKGRQGMSGISPLAKQGRTIFKCHLLRVITLEMQLKCIKCSELS